MRAWLLAVPLLSACSAAVWTAVLTGVNDGLQQQQQAQANAVAAPVDNRCFVAFVHGMTGGVDLTPGVATDEARRAYWQGTRGSSDGDFISAVSREGTADACVTLVVGYDGGAAFIDQRAAGSAARQLADFVNTNSIPDGRLVIVAHSMGGLVIRWILNRPSDGLDNTTVVRATRYAITLSTPHLGSPAA